MTNEELYRQYLSGDAEAFERLYLQMQGFIASVAKDAAQSFGCSDKETLDELCAEGALELCECLSTGEYSEERGKLTTYLYPFLRGKMYRYLEANVGAAALPKDEMQQIKQAQRLHKDEMRPLDEVAQLLGVSAEKAAQLIGCKTKSLSVSELSNDDSDDDPLAWLLLDQHTLAGTGCLPAGLHGGTGAAFSHTQRERPGNPRPYLRRIRLRKAVCGRAWPARNALDGRCDQSQKIRIGAPAQPVPRQRSAPLAGCVSCAERYFRYLKTILFLDGFLQTRYSKREGPEENSSGPMVYSRGYEVFISGICLKKLRSEQHETNLK